MPASIATDYVPGKPRLAYDHSGAGPTLLFLHGIGGNRTNWRDQLAACRDEFHAVAWDARGYGLSEDYEGALDFADFGRDLLRLLDHLGAARAHVCGLSMGGGIALDFHAQYPARVASLVLCDTFAGFATSFSTAERAEFVRSRQAPLLTGKEPRDIAPAVAATLVAPSASPQVLARVVASMTALHKQSYLKAIEAVSRYDRSASLAEIKVPTLLLYGAEDRLTPLALGREMAARIPGARLVTIEAAGHLPNIERPEAFNAAVLGFLRGLRAASCRSSG